jgi:hypothetical protein
LHSGTILTMLDNVDEIAPFSLNIVPKNGYGCSQTNRSDDAKPVMLGCNR